MRTPAINSSLLSTLGLLALTAGCMVGPHYHKPKTTVPQAFHGASPAGAQTGTGTPAASGTVVTTEPDERWWTLFNDPTLNSLIDRALANNRDLKTAVLRVREARFEREVVASGLIPDIAATAGYNRSRGSKNVVLPLGGAGGASSASGGSSGGSTSKSDPSNSTGRATPSPLQVSPSSGGSTGGAGGGGGSSSGVPPGGPQSPFGEGGLPGVTTNLFQVGFDAVWEIDVFGGTRRAIQAANAQAEAAVEAERGVRISLMAEVANSYLELRSLQDREAIARRNWDAEQKTWKLAEDRLKAGLGDESQAAQAAAQAATTEASIPPIVASEEADRHALAYILAVNPNDLDTELADAKALPDIPPTVPIGVPSDLLRRRPDIRQAERQLAASVAEVGVATAQLFPQFSLTGAMGYDSSTLKRLVDRGSNYYSVAPGISWPLLDWTRLHAQIRAENALEGQAMLAYENAVAEALKDVEDALVHYESDKARHDALDRAVTEGRRAVQVARQTFSEGLANEEAVLNDEHMLLQAEDSLAQSDASLRTDLVALYKALGGGWESENNSPPLN